MKILLIHTEEEKEISDHLLSTLTKPDLYVDTLLLKSVEDADIKRFIDFFVPAVPEGKEERLGNIPSHAIILSPLSGKWFDFLAGFSCGSRLSLLVYGQEAIAGISKEFAFCFTFLNTDESFNTFFEAEYEAFKKQEAAREVIKAQETLLQIGVPVTAESLANCVAEGGTNEVSLFLAAGFSPDTRNKAGVPLLHIAARNGNLENLKFLISAGANINMQADDRGSSALIDATMAKKHDLLSELINAGADLNIKSKDGQTALIIAAGASNETASETLLKAGADPDITDSLGVSARKYASLFRQKSMMDLFENYAPPKL